uniref:Ice-binding protein isoform 2 n=1 Tax=Chlamydomonas raudensis TaxID=284013 RepID=L7X088_9CHLO|nr:ice-binding protein isoform 2 [Chlamydomonas raudensis]
MMPSKAGAAALALLLLLAAAAQADECTQAPVDLGDASEFAVLAGVGVTTGAGIASQLTGDLGVFPGGPAPMTGMALSMNAAISPVTGTLSTIYLADAPADPAERGVAEKGIDALLFAFNDVKNRTVPLACTTPAPQLVSGNIVARRSTRPLHVAAGLSVTGGVDLYLDGNNDTSAVFIFQCATTLLLTAGRSIVLTNGANAKNIFWQVGSSATLETLSHLEGTVLAMQSVTVALGATVNGRVLARLASVTMDQVVISLP